MADEKQSQESRAKPESIPVDKGTEAPAVSCPPRTPKELTAEEQMALYEEKLKEEDWGHQPC